MDNTLLQRPTEESSTAGFLDPYELLNVTPQNTLRIGWSDTWLIEPTLDDSWQVLEPIERRGSLVLPSRLTDPLYGKEGLDQKLREMATQAPAIERVWEITEKLPSLSKLLSEERDNE